MKKLRKRKSYSTFSLNSIDSRRKWKSLAILLFFFILLNSLLSGSGSGAPKKGTQGTGVRQKPCFLPSLLNFFFIWTELTAGQLLDSWRNGETLFFVYFFWTAADVQQNEKVCAKTTFFIELNCRRGRAEWKKKVVKQCVSRKWFLSENQGSSMDFTRCF